MTRFFKKLWKAFTTPVRPIRSTAPRTRLSLDALEARDLMTVSPLGQAFTVAPIGSVETLAKTVARDDFGDFAVVWDSHDANTGGVYVNLYNANGKKLMSTQIDNDPHDYQATVAMDGHGDFAVAWDYYSEILVQRFDAQGHFVGGFDVVASAYTNYDPSIALNDNGKLVVAYDQIIPNDSNVYVNLWSQGAADQPAVVFAAGSSTGDPQPAIAMNDNNEGVIAYAQDDATGTSIMTFFAFNPETGLGGGRGLLHQAVAEGAYQDSNPSVAINESGTMLVAYTNTFYLNSANQGPIVDQQVEVVRYTSDFTFLGDQHVLAVVNNPSLNEFPFSSMQYRPSAAIDGAGDFVIMARQELSHFNLFADAYQLVSTSVVGQVFGANGSPLSGAFGVGSVADNPTTHTQDLPSVAMDGPGNFVVTYQDTTPAGNTLMAMRFANTNGNQGFVGLQDQSISFDAPADATYGDGAITLDGTADSGLPVSYQILSGPATVVGDTLTITGAGTVTVEASQAGDGASYAAAVPVDQSFTVNPAVLTVTADNQARFVGQADPTFTATITGFVNGETLDTSGVTGTPAFTSDDAPDSPAGAYTITPAQGSLTAANYEFTFANGTLTVNSAVTTVALQASAASAGVGQPITFTATVAAQDPNAGVPDGTVTFTDGGNVLGTVNVDSNGVAVLQTANVGLGTHAVTAVYNGSTSFAGSTSAAVNATILPASITTLQSSRASSTVGQSITLTASVAPASGRGKLTGTVTFMDGSAILGTATLKSGKATLKTAQLAPGTHAITAVYNGTTLVAGSTSAVLTPTVHQAATTIALTSSAKSTVFGRSITLTARIHVSAPGQAIPTGTVTFMDGANVLGTGTVNKGIVVLTLANLARGKHPITAVYSGDDDVLGSTSAIVIETIK